MTIDLVTLLAAAVILAATLLRATFGFGEALVAMPLLSMLVGIGVAAPLIALISVTVGAVILLTDWRDVHMPTAGRLLLAAVFGIPVGLYLVSALPEQSMKTVLAVVIIGFSSYSLVGHRELHLTNDRYAYVAGFLGGVLGGAYNVQGLPLVVYGALRKWSATNFRATLQGFFLPTSVIILIGHALAGRLTFQVLSLYLFALPSVLAALWGGNLLHRSVRDKGFLRYVYFLLILIGLVLLVESRRGP